MSTYRVYGKMEIYCQKLVEADSEDGVEELFSSGKEEFTMEDYISDDYDIYSIEKMEEE